MSNKKRAVAIGASVMALPFVFSTMVFAQSMKKADAAQPAHQRVLTTQLYFPGESANDRDGIFDPALLMDVKDRGDAKEGTFTFVLKAV